MAKKIREPVIIEAFRPLKAEITTAADDHRGAARPRAAVCARPPSAAISFAPAICAGASA